MVTDAGVGLDWDIKITGDAASADEEAAANFPTELRKLIRVYSPLQVLKRFLLGKGETTVSR